MKKFVSFFLLVGVLFGSFIGCGKVIVATPVNKNISLGAGNIENADVQKRVFYALWGLAPISENNTANMMESIPDNSQIIVQSEINFVDFLVSLFLGVVTIQSKTVTIDVK